MPPAANGNTTRRKVPTRVAPSMWAASSSSRGDGLEGADEDPRDEGQCPDEVGQDQPDVVVDEPQLGETGGHRDAHRELGDHPGDQEPDDHGVADAGRHAGDDVGGGGGDHDRRRGRAGGDRQALGERAPEVAALDDLLPEPQGRLGDQEVRAFPEEGGAGGDRDHEHEVDGEQHDEGRHHDPHREEDLQGAVERVPTAGGGRGGHRQRASSVRRATSRR